MFKDDVNQRVLTAYAQGFQPKDDAFVRAGIRDERGYQRLCDGLVAELSAMAEANQSPQQVVLSGEHMQSRLYEPEQVQRLKRLLTSVFDEITVYIHLRPQVDLARSLASTLVRGGGMVNPKRYLGISESNPYFNYFALVNRWQAEFGAANLRIIPYKRQPSMVAVIKQALGLPDDGFSEVPRQNTELDWRVIAMLNAMKPYRQARQAGPDVPHGLESLPCEQPLSFGMELSQSIETKMRAGNEALIALRPELEAGDLSSDSSELEQEENLSRVNEGAVFAEPMARLFALMQRQIEVERFFRRLAESERAMLNKQPERAQGYFLEALALLNSFDEEARNQPPLLDAQIRVDRLTKSMLDRL